MALDPFTLALLTGGIGQMLQSGSQAVGAYGAGQDLKLTPDQVDRLRELERRAAQDALGLTAAERERFRAEAMSPVQTAEREAIARQAQQQQIADIGQAETFRGQQALKETAQAARAQVDQSVAQRDAQMAIQQQEEMDRLRQQQLQSKAMERQAAMALIGGLGQATSQIGGLQAQKAMMDESLNKQKAQLTGAAKNTVAGAAKMLGISTSAGEAASAGMKAVEDLSKPTLGVNGVDAVQGMTRNRIPDYVMAIDNWGKTGSPTVQFTQYNPVTGETIETPLDALKALRDYLFPPKKPPQQ
tara:strand:- start:467 stop:1369 length:903 start_codon:yes stop_codon:yes gene_type:complete